MPRCRKRQGSIVPLLAISLVALCTFAALAVDIGMIAVAKSQCQNAADMAAMAGVRELNGEAASVNEEGEVDPETKNNKDQAIPTAKAAAALNTVLGQDVLPAKVEVSVGKYYYDGDQEKFVAYPIDPGSTDPEAENWSLVSVTVASQSAPAFSRVLGMKFLDVSAEATAVHRPRDIAIVMDFSGSMRFGSLLGIDYTGAREGTNNPEEAYPQFGPYSATATAALRRSSSPTAITITNADGSTTTNNYPASNVTVAHSLNHDLPPVIDDFYQHAQGSDTHAKAFSKAPDSQGATPAGDKPLRMSNNNSSQPYAKTFRAVINSTSAHSSFETNGYTHFTGQAFNGYTAGPGYWGKTFWIWPPDPRTAHDWRRKFFLNSSGAAFASTADVNAALFDSAGVLKRPRTGASTINYYINYQAILNWIQNTGTNPFPSRLRAGGISYYDSIPSGTDATLNNRFWTQFPLTNTNERFWKDYIDYVLGFDQTTSNSYASIFTNVGYGGFFSWSDATDPVAIYARPSGRYMDYRDNPQRPRTHFWFGGMTMVDFLGCYNRWGSVAYQKNACWPGTCHESPMYACKLGVQAAIQDSKNNHPNDWLSLIFFSHPRGTSNAAGSRFNRVRAPLGQDYQRMINMLWYPESFLDTGTEINPYDYDKNIEVPRALGGTCYSMALMLAYNQFSSNEDLRDANPGGPTGDAGGMGRKGAQKIVIFETDGAPNFLATASLTAGNYYDIVYNSDDPDSGNFPTVVQYSTNNHEDVRQEIFGICEQLCASTDASPPGYSTPRKPARIYCIAFGSLLNDAAKGTLNEMQAKSGLGPMAGYQIVNGTDEEMATQLTSAISRIMQEGVPVTLIK